MECKVKQIIQTGVKGGAANLVICEIILMHINDAVLNEQGKIDPLKIDQVARMGGDWYSRAAKGLFEVPKPLTTLGIGVDQLPASVRNSTVLTGNDLGMLGGITQLPDETTVNEYKLTELADMFIDYENDAKVLELKLHERAHSLLEQSQVNEAWMTLLAFNN